MRWLVLVVALVACAGHPGISAEEVGVRTAIVTANTTRLTIETAETTAKTLYREQQRQAVLDVKARGGTKDEAKAAVEKIRGDWDRVWDVFAKAREAHRLLVEAIKAYDQGKQIAVDVIALARQLTEAQNELAAVIADMRGE
jgi:uncharacterized protein YjaG (DUF416 family)